jgi:hypothetical protein
LVQYDTRLLENWKNVYHSCFWSSLTGF